MTALEMYNEFRTGYDEATSFSGPALDHYDISVFLTRAQDNLLKRRLFPQGNKYGETFDDSEKRKRDYDQLLRTAQINTLASSQEGVVPNGVFFILPADHMLTVMERADIKILVPDPCYPTGIIYNVLVKPITWDTYMSNKDNPFRKPNKQVIWRLVHSAENSNAPISASNVKRQQLITDGTYNIYVYHITYLRRPTPIVTGNLTGTLTVDGVSVQTACELDHIIHREIVAEAVRLASASLKDPGYQFNAAESQLSE